MNIYTSIWLLLYILAGTAVVLCLYRPLTNLRKITLKANEFDSQPSIDNKSSLP